MRVAVGGPANAARAPRSPIAVERVRQSTGVRTRSTASAPTAPRIVDAVAVDDRARGDRRPLRPEPHDVFAREHDAHRAPGRVGELTRGGGDHRRLLAAERAAVRERRRRLAARRAPRRVGLEVRGLDPAGGEPHAAAAAAAGSASGGAVVDRGAPALHLAREPRASSNDSATTQPMPAARSTARVEPGRQRHRDQRVAGRGVVGEPAPPERDVGPDRCAHAALELRAPRRRVGVRAASSAARWPSTSGAAATSSAS